MSHTKLIKQLKEKNPQLNQSEIENIINIFLDSISDTLKNGNSLEIRGFGRWYFSKLKENYNSRNPSTNEVIYKPSRIRVRFRASKNLKMIINK